MKILMVYPEYPATFWSFKYALPFTGKKVSLPPLGLLTLSAMLPREWERKLIDENAQKVTDAELNWADMVFVSGMIVQKKSAQKIITRAKKLNKYVVAGGPLFTTGYKDFTGVNTFVLNEGEVTLPMFLDDAKKGTIKHLYTSDEKPDITKTPAPDWKLLRQKDYASLAMQISRGCPFNCEFCDIIVINGRVPRVKTPEQVKAEFQAVYDSGWRGSIFIVDDNFIGNKAKIKEILRVIIVWMNEHGKPFTLYTEASVNLADDPELMALMREANFGCVFVGIETPDDDALRSCGKVQNTGKDLVEKVKIMQRNGMQVQAGFIVGFDQDTPRTFDNMIKFIQKSGIVTSMVGMLTALPETRLYNRLKEAGRLLKKSTGDNTDFSLNFIPKMDAAALVAGYKKVLSAVFDPKNYYERIITFLKEYKKFAKETKLGFVTLLKAAAKAFWQLGVVGEGRRYFWKMVAWTTVKKPLLLPEAITLAVYGYHYRMVMEKGGA